MPKVEVQTESETGHGWSYAVRVHADDGSASDHTVTLSWADHEHWCGGRTPPSKMVEAVVAYALARRADLPPRFDAARVRRWAPTIDRDLRSPPTSGPTSGPG